MEGQHFFALGQRMRDFDPAGENDEQRDIRLPLLEEELAIRRGAFVPEGVHARDLRLRELRKHLRAPRVGVVARGDRDGDRELRRRHDPRSRSSA